MCILIKHYFLNKNENIKIVARRGGTLEELEEKIEDLNDNSRPFSITVSRKREDSEKSTRLRDAMLKCVPLEKKHLNLFLCGANRLNSLDD